VIDIDENGVVSVEINASTQSGDAITLKLEGNIKTTVDADGVTTIEASDSNITINPNGDINVTTPTGSSIAIPDGSGDVEITQDADGNTQFIITNLDGTTEVTTEVTLKTDGQIEVATSNGGIVIPSGNGDSNITTNENGNTVIENTNPNGATTTIIINDDGTFKVVTKDIDGNLIEDKTYPTNTQITLGDPVEIYYKDENGYWITKHIKSDGTVTTYNSDDTTTISKQKVNGNGDLVTDVTLPQYIDGNVVEQNDGSTTFSITDSEYSYDINITNTGSLDIDTTGANGTHNITVANPGADINISNEGNMTITTPIFTNLDGTTCGYSLDIAYDGSDMITKHTLSNTGDEDIITTIIMRIPNSNVDVTSDNKVVHYGSFTNTANPNKDVNVTATVNCKGEVSTITKISDQNASLIALNKPGSTVIIYTDGAVDAQLPITNVGSDDVKQLKFSVDPNSGDITTQKIFTDNNISEVVYPVGAKVVANNTNIAEVIVDLTNPNIVKVDVKDENNNTITTTTTIDSSFTVNRTSEGEDGKITSEINATGGAKIVIDNFVDGKAKHLVEVNGVSTEATSNIEGADINVTNSGVTTTFEDTNVKAEVTATLDGKAAHKMTTPNGTTEATSHIPGAKTVIDKDANGNPKILTKVSTTNSNSKVVDIEVDASSDGSAVHKITVDGVSSTATSNIVGAKTIIDENGSVETAVGEVADGTTYVIKAKVITDTTGKAITRFVRVNQNDENDLTVLSNTMTVDTKYEAGNEVTIDLIEETLFIKTVAPLTDNLEVE